MAPTAVLLTVARIFSEYSSSYDGETGKVERKVVTALGFLGVRGRMEADSLSPPERS